MATEKKYLDLQGLQHLKEQGILVKHNTGNASDAAAVKVGKDANGHVVLGGALSYNDLDDKPTIGNGTLTIQANGTSKGSFKANQTGDTTINITAADLGLASAMHFIGTSLTALENGSTTSTIKIKEHSSDTTGRSHNAENGDVVLYNTKEFVFSKLANAWYELGDQGSHALNTITISGDNTYITGGGNLQDNRTLSHKTYTAADAAAVKIGRDAGGHVVIGGALSAVSNGAHTHSVSSTIPANSFLTSASGTTTKISLSPTTDTFVKSYPGVKSNLVTTTITGVSGSTSASAVSGGTTKDIASAGTAVVYGKANVGDKVTVATRAATQTTVGNANVGTEISITGVSGSTTASKATAGTAKDVAKAGTAITVAKRDTTAKTIGNANVGAEVSYATGVVSSATATTTAMKADYDATTECLTFTVGTVTPTVTLATSKLTPATTSTTTIYGCSSTDASVTPAVSNGTITPYTFENSIPTHITNIISFLLIEINCWYLRTSCTSFKILCFFHTEHTR